MEPAFFAEFSRPDGGAVWDPGTGRLRSGHTPPLDAQFAPGNGLEGLRIRDMLLVLDAGVQGLRRIGIEDRDGELQDDRARIHALVDEVDGAARDLRAIIQGLSPRLETRKRRQQRGVNIDNSPSKSTEQPLFYDPHEARQDDHVDPVVLQQLHRVLLRLAVEFCPERRAIDEVRGDIPCGCPLQDPRVRHVTEDAGHDSAQPLRIDRIQDRLEIRAAAGSDDAESDHRREILAARVRLRQVTCVPRLGGRSRLSIWNNRALARMSKMIPLACIVLSQGALVVDPIRTPV